MIPFSLLSGQSSVCVTVALFASFALAALQNVTVDDATLTGAVVPQYIPESEWNVGNECEGCAAKPNPSLAYNGTWHDTSFFAGNGDATQFIQFNFTGSGLYIYFILANTIPGHQTTTTNVSFILDNTITSYLHSPNNTTDYNYNMTVYANDALDFAEHTMTIEPVNTGENVLILFDYLIYTTEVSNSTSSPSSSSSSDTQRTPSGSNIGAIVGGTVGGVFAFALVITSLLCYRRYKRHSGAPPLEADESGVEPFIEVAPTLQLTGSLLASLASRGKTGPTGTTNPQTPEPASSASGSSSSGVSSGNNTGLLEQVGMLRNEVARLREAQNSDRNTMEFHSEPPGYSD